MTAPEPFLFVSHVSEDRDAAMAVVEELERRGIPCWIAPRNINPGKPFDDEIAAAIEGSRAMLLIFSELCNDSEYIRREVTVAGESQKVIIPFRVDKAQPKRGLRVRLSDLHWIDGFTSRERAIDELVKNFERSPASSAPQPLAASTEPRARAAPHDKTEARLAAVGAAPRQLGLTAAALIGALLLGAAATWFALKPGAQSTVVSGWPSSDARRHQCIEEGQIKSLDARQAVSAIFVNERDSPIRLYWLDYAGLRKLYATLKPGERQGQATFATHP
jgi:TIR domain/VHL beta domain